MVAMAPGSRVGAVGGVGGHPIGLLVVLGVAALVAPAAQAACDCSFDRSSVRPQLEKVTPVEYQSAAFRWSMPAGFDDHECCVTGWRVRWRNPLDFYDPWANAIPTYMGEDKHIPLDVTSKRVLVLIPGQDLDVVAQMEFRDGTVSAEAEISVVAGMSPIAEPGNDANNAGVHKDRNCGNTIRIFSEATSGGSFEEVVVPKAETWILDETTPRIGVLKIFGCLVWGGSQATLVQAMGGRVSGGVLRDLRTVLSDTSAHELRADKVLVVGKFLAGTEASPLTTDASVMLHGYDIVDGVPQQDPAGGGGSYENTAAGYSVSWRWTGTPNEFSSRVIFDICTTERNAPPGVGLWASVGFSGDGRMANSDFLVCKFDADGRFAADDLVGGSGHAAPLPDWTCDDGPACRPDVTVLSYGDEGLGRHCCSIERAIFTQDDKDVDLTTSMHLLMAKGRLDDAGGLLQHSWMRDAGRLKLDTSGREYHGAIGKKVFAALGGSTVSIYAQPVVSWTQLDAHALSGQTSITLKEPVDWPSGRQIWFANTDFKDTNTNTDEFATVDRVDPSDPRKVHLTSALRRSKYGEIMRRVDDQGNNWDFDMRGEVALFWRSFRIQGDASSYDSKRGGHTIYLKKATVQLHHVELKALGQEGVAARYPTHFHLFGDASTSAIQGCLIRDSFWRALSFHGAQKGNFENNVMHGVPDKAVWFEEGSEEDNRVIGNLVAPADRTPGIWFENMNNIIRGNHIVSGGQCFDYHFDDVTPQPTEFGSLIGDPRNEGENSINGFVNPVGGDRFINTATSPFGPHEHNVCHSSEMLLNTWRMILSCDEPHAWACGWPDRPRAVMLMRWTTVYKLKQIGGTYFATILALRDSRVADVCGGIPAMGGTPGGNWARDPELGLLDGLNPWVRNGFVYVSDNEFGRSTKVQCADKRWGHIRGALRAGYPFYVADSYFDMYDYNGGVENRAIIVHPGRERDEAMETHYFKNVTITPETTHFAHIDIEPRSDNRFMADRYVTKDIDGRAASKLMTDHNHGEWECSVNAEGRGPWIAPDVQYWDPVGCQLVGGSDPSEGAMVCDGNLIYEFFEMWVFDAPAGMQRRPGLKYCKESYRRVAGEEPRGCTFIEHSRGSSGNIASYWPYSIYYPWNGPGTGRGPWNNNGEGVDLDVHEITFIDNLDNTQGTVSDAADLCEPMPARLYLRAGHYWFPEHVWASHRFRIKVTGFGARPQISLRSGTTVIASLEAGQYSATYDQGRCTIVYDPATRFVELDWSTAVSELDIRFAESPLDPTPAFDREACLAERGATEKVFAPGSYTTSDGVFSLIWTLQDEETIKFTMMVETGGWAALGIADSAGSMSTADVMVCNQDANGDGHIEDRFNGVYYSYLGGAYQPSYDDQQDWVLISTDKRSTAQGPRTQCVFTRKLDTGDNAYDRVIDPDASHWIWAAGPDNNADIDGKGGKTMPQHIYMGSFEQSLWIDQEIEDRRRRTTVAASFPPPPPRSSLRARQMKGHTGQAPAAVESEASAPGWLSRLFASQSDVEEKAADRVDHVGRQLFEFRGSASTTNVDNEGHCRYYDWSPNGYCQLEDEMMSVRLDTGVRCWNLGCEAPSGQYTGFGGANDVVRGNVCERVAGAPTQTPTASPTAGIQFCAHWRATCTCNGDAFYGREGVGLSEPRPTAGGVFCDATEFTPVSFPGRKSCYCREP